MLDATYEGDCRAGATTLTSLSRLLTSATVACLSETGRAPDKANRLLMGSPAVAPHRAKMIATALRRSWDGCMLGAVRNKALICDRSGGRRRTTSSKNIPEGSDGELRGKDLTGRIEPAQPVPPNEEACGAIAHLRYVHGCVISAHGERSRLRSFKRQVNPDIGLGSGEGKAQCRRNGIFDMLHITAGCRRSKQVCCRDCQEQRCG